MTQTPATFLRASSTNANTDHFATDHLMADLKGRSVRGGAVTLSAQGTKFALQMGSTMVLARLLSPSDFGLIAMVTAVTGFVAMFKDAGLSMATVQRKEITHDQVSTLFWLNLALSAAVMLVVAAMAPLIAAFYSEPRLVWVTIALAGTMLFGGLTVQHQALLRRQMRFKSLAVVEIASMAGGIAVAITMALMDFGYWSLVGMIGGTAIINAGLVWVLCDWRPGLPKRGSGVGEMLKFGGNLTGASVLSYSRRNLDNVLIGAIWGSASLGLYSKAYQLLLLPVRQINAPLTAVALPALSRLSDQPAQYRHFYRQFIECIAFAGFPLMLYALTNARTVVLALLGDHWLGAVPLFQALAPAAMISVINVAGGIVFISTGRTDKQLRATVVSTFVVVLGFVIALPFGPLGIAISFSTTFMLTFPGIVWYAIHGTPVTGRDVLAALWRPFTAAVTACVPTYGFSRVAVAENFSPILSLGLSALLFAVVYSALICIIPGGRHLLAGLLRILLQRRMVGPTPRANSMP